MQQHIQAGGMIAPLVRATLFIIRAEHDDNKVEVCRLFARDGLHKV